MIAEIILASLEVGLFGVFFVAAADAAIYRGVGLRSDFRIGELHHAYLGGLLVVVGWFVSPWLMVAGVLVTGDDTWQHHVQTWRCEPEYRSPLHRLFGATLWRWRWIQDLTRWLDERL